MYVRDIVDESAEVRTLASPIKKAYWGVPGIYGIWSLITGRWYIGSSTNIALRIHEHIADLKRGHHHSAYLQRSFNKHGINSFAMEILEQVSGGRDELLLREKAWIDRMAAYIDGYNTTETPSCPEFSKETRAKMSIAQKARKDLVRIAYAFYHPDHGTVTGVNIKAFSDKYGIHNSGMNRVHHGVYAQYCGWTKAHHT